MDGDDSRQADDRDGSAGRGAGGDGHSRSEARDGTGTARSGSDADERAEPSSESPWDLRHAWREHRPYVVGAAGLFGAALLLGVGLSVGGVDLLELLGIDDVEELIGEDAELTVEFILTNNTRAYLLMVGGALTVGLLTAMALLSNGLLVGWVVAESAAADGLGVTLALILPHGVLELPALWIAAGIAFRLVHAAGAYLLGDRDRFLSREELGRTAILLVAGWVVLAVAAVVEVYVTPAIAEALFDVEIDRSLG